MRQVNYNTQVNSVLPTQGGRFPLWIKPELVLFDHNSLLITSLFHSIIHTREIMRYATVSWQKKLEMVIVIKGTFLSESKLYELHSLSVAVVRVWEGGRVGGLEVMVGGWGCERGRRGGGWRGEGVRGGRWRCEGEGVRGGKWRWGCV